MFVKTFNNNVRFTLPLQVVALWQDTENMVLSLTRSANVVLELDTKCQVHTTPHTRRHTNHMLTTY